MITLGELVKRLGGASVVAARCKLTTAAVSNWVQRGDVAAEHRIAVWAMAIDAELDWVPRGADGLALVRKEAA